MIRSVQLHRLTSHILSCTRGSCLLTGQMPYGVQPSSPGHTSMQQIFHGPLIPKITALPLSKESLIVDHIKFSGLLCQTSHNQSAAHTNDG
ncbi:transmembrane protein 186 isoform X4 [Toxotes jaculatrix]|uniref:transmembrane protein 186 isoform X4 n=1 Tax=Toxotes jaculatrix TaxID=941984 RepID=UPI001B3A7C55|nr:transmembrane protein 186 isoform X4 [Toxotes jaculatrix]